MNEVTGPSSDPYLPTEGSDPDGRLAITADGSRIYFNDYGEVGYVDTASGVFVLPAPVNYAIAQTNYELTLNANQTSFFAAGFITDSNFNSFGMQELNLAADGSLLFQPGSQAIDVFDGRTGAFRARIGLPVQLSPNFRALVSNNQDSRLVAITGTTGNGIAVIDLNSLPEPAPLQYLSATAQPASHSLPIAHATEHASGQVNTAFPQAAKVHRRSSSLLAPLARQRQAESALTIDR